MMAGQNEHFDILHPICCGLEMHSYAAYQAHLFIKHDEEIMSNYNIKLYFPREYALGLRELVLPRSSEFFYHLPVEVFQKVLEFHLEKCAKWHAKDRVQPRLI
jgi:hypothetical protein